MPLNKILTASELLKAFGPIITRQRQLTRFHCFTKVGLLSIDKEKLKAGVPVIQQINLFSPDDPLKEIALSLTSAVKEGMPKLAEEH